LQAYNIFNDSMRVLLLKADNSQPSLMKDRTRMDWQLSEE